MVTALFVLARIVANPVSNVFQKQLAQQSANPVFIIGVTHVLLTIVALPLLPGALTPGLDEAFWTSMTLSALLAVAGNVLLVYALRSTDLSILGPINAYKSVISLVLGIFLIGEFPTVAGVAGMLLIIAGSYFIVDRAVDQPRRNAFVLFFRERGVQLRFAALAFSATEAVFLKRAILHSSPLTTFVLWCGLGVPIAAAAIALVLRAEVRGQLTVLRAHASTYLWLGVTTGLMQLTTLLTFGELHVGYSLALFQMSTLISVLLGYRFFQESNIRKRLLGSLVMVAGAVMIVLSGGRG